MQNGHHHHHHHSSNVSQINSDDGIVATTIIIALPFVLEFLTLQDLVKARLTSRKWKETVEQQSMSVRHCAILLQQRLLQDNVHLAVGNNLLRDSWKSATNESLEHIMRLFQSSSSLSSTVPITAATTCTNVTSIPTFPSSSSSASPLRKLLATLRILRSMPMEAAIGYSRLYGRHVLPLVRADSSSSTNSNSSSNNVHIQTFPPCPYHTPQDCCQGCRLVNNIPLKQQQQQEHSSVSSLLHHDANSNNQEQQQQPQQQQQGPRLLGESINGSDTNNNNDVENQSSSTRTLGYQLDDYFVIFEKSDVNDDNSNNDTVSLKPAASVSAVTTAAASPPSTVQNETVVVATNADANSLNQQQQQPIKPRRGRRVLQLETYFPVCAPNLLPDMACPICGLDDKDIFTRTMTPVLTVAAAAAPHSHTDQQESLLSPPKIQQERTLFLTEISYPSLEACHLWTDTKLTFTPQLSAESTATAVSDAEPRSASVRAFPQEEQEDHDDRVRRGDSNFTSTTQRRVRRRLSSDVLDLLAPTTTTSTSVNVVGLHSPGLMETRLGSQCCSDKSKEFVYPPAPYFDVAVPIGGPQQPRSSRPRPPMNAPPPRPRPTVAAGPYLHHDNVKNCLSIHCNKCKQFALLAPAVPCHSHSFACDGIRSLNAMQQRQQARRRKRTTQGGRAVDDDFNNIDDDDDNEQDGDDDVLDQSEDHGIDDDGDDDATIVIGAVMVRRRCNGSSTCQKATYCMACSQESWHFPFLENQNGIPDDLIVHRSACNPCNLRLCREHAWLSTVCHHS